MKILITWIGPWLDKGQAAMLISMKYALQGRLSDLSITASASSFSPQDIDIARYGEYDLKVLAGIIPNIIETVPKFDIIKSKATSIKIALPFVLAQTIKTIFWLILFKTLRFDAGFLIANNKEIIGEYRDADCIIFCGGQYITNLNFGLLIALYEIIFSKKLGKPVMIWANSLGPFDPKYIHPFMRWVLNKVDLITTREATSKRYLDRIGVKAPSFLTADAAFLLPAVSSENALSLLEYEINIPKDKLMIGITVINWTFPGESDPNKKFEAYLAAVADAVDYVIDKFDAHVFFFPQVIISNTKDDRPISEKVLSKVRNKLRATVLKKDYSPEQLKGMYGCMSLLIGTRFHSCILAQSMHVPTIAVEYDGHKALGIMRLLELENYVCDIRTITANELISKVDEIWNERANVTRKLEKNIRIMQADSMENLNLAVKYLGFEKDLKF